MLKKILLSALFLTISITNSQAQSSSNGNEFFMGEYTIEWALKVEQAELNEKSWQAAQETYGKQATMLAKSENPEAKARLGYLYEAGLGVNKDLLKAHENFKAAEADGNLFAKYWLGNKYINGYVISEGMIIPKDHEKALQLIRSSAEAGFPASQNLMSLLYGNGVIVNADGEAALDWVQKAAEGGHYVAQLDFGLYLLNTALSEERWLPSQKQRETMSGEKKSNIDQLDQEIKNKKLQGINLITESAVQGYWEAENALGELYFMGNGVERSNETAMRWFRKAADKGYSPAHFGLYHTYMVAGGNDPNKLSGIHLYEADNENEETAIKHLLKAADNQYPAAMLWMADRYSRKNSLYPESFDQAEWDKAKRFASQFAMNVKSENIAPENTYTLAKIFDRLQDYSKALEYFMLTVDKIKDPSENIGIANESYKAIAMIYLEGKGVSPDLTEANRWFNKYIGDKANSTNALEVTEIQREHFKIDDPDWTYLGESERGEKFYYHPASIIKIGSDKDYIVLVKKQYPLNDYWKNKGLTSTPVTIRGYAHYIKSESVFVGQQEKQSLFKIGPSGDVYEKTGTGYLFKFADNGGTSGNYLIPVLDKLTQKLY